MKNSDGFEPNNVTTPAASSDNLQFLPSALADDHRRRGATLAAYHGAEVPLRFGDAPAEHRAVRTAAGLFDFSFRAKFTLSGEHRVRFLHRIVSNDVKSLSTGQGVYATLLSAQGRILADLRVYADSDQLWIDTDADLRGKAMNTLRRYIVGDRVEVELREVYAAALQGPASRDVLARMLGVTLDGLDQEMHHQVLEHSGSTVRVVRLSSTGEEGYEVWLDHRGLRRFWDAALESCAVGTLVMCGTEALESLRIEAGIPRYGPDFGEDTLPLEAGLLGALSFNKGCYIGQEIVERARSRGHVNWKLAGLLFAPGATVPAPGQPLAAEGKLIGEITSACFSPTLERPLALAYVRREVAEPGAQISLQNGDSVEVTGLPFLRPK